MTLISPLDYSANPYTVAFLLLLKESFTAYSFISPSASFPLRLSEHDQLVLANLPYKSPQTFKSQSDINQLYL